MGWERVRHDSVIEHHFIFVEFFSEEIRLDPFSFLDLIILMLGKNWKKRNYVVC